MRKRLNSISKKYLEGSEEHFHSLNSLKAAAQNYIQIREGWGEGRSKYGWRGGIGGRLFFNRRKTTNNIRVMYQVIAVVDDHRMTFDQKVRDIKILKTQLTSKGVGRELLDVFLQTALGETSAYIPKNLSSDLEKSVLVERTNRYERQEVLGRGAYGQVTRFQEQRTGRKVVVKEMHNADTDHSDLKIEMRLFQKVYNYLGKPYFGIDAEAFVVPSHYDHEHSTVLMPEIPGANIVDFVNYYHDYNEQMLFNSLFNFLWAMHHDLRIAHRDAHPGNIMVLDGLYNVFFIDYGLAFEIINDGYLMDEKIRHFLTSMLKDLTSIISIIFYLRFHLKKGGNTISFADLNQTYNLERWRDYAFAGQSMEEAIMQSVNNRLIHIKVPGILKL